MIVAACWMLAVTVSTVFGVLLTISETIAARVAPVVVLLVLPCWLYLVHHHERTRHRDS